MQCCINIIRVVSIYLFLLACIPCLGQNYNDTITNVIKTTKPGIERISLFLKYARKLRVANPEIGVKFSNKGLEEAKAINNDSLIGKALFYVASSYYFGGNHSDAMKNYLECLKLTKSYPKLKIRTVVCIGIGVLYAYRDKYKESLEYFEKALKLAKDQNDIFNEGQARKQIMAVYNLQGKYDKAVLNGEIANTLSEGTDESTIILLAEAYGGQGNFKKAEELGRLGLSLVKPNDVSSEGEATKTLGFIYSRKKEYKKAEVYFNKAIECFKTIGSKGDLGKTHQMISTMYSDAGDYKNSLLHLREAFRYTTEDKNENNIEEVKIQYLEKEARLRHEQEKLLMQKEQQFKTELYESDKKRQKVILYSIITGLLLVVVFSFNLYRRFKITNQQKQIIEAKERETSEQKKTIEEKQKDILDSIRYAKRIQSSLLPSEKYIERIINRCRIL